MKVTRVARISSRRDGPVTRILVVEDDRTIALGLQHHLQDAGYEVELASNGSDALRAARRLPPALLLLDLMLPDLDGFDVLAAIRRGGGSFPVLIVTARDSEAYTLTGFRLGADDYVVKPFRIRELLARVEALLRRGVTQDKVARDELAPRSIMPDHMAFGEVVVDAHACRVTRNGETVMLRPKEYDLLLALLARREGVVSRATLLREVWGYDPLVISRTVETHILELRRKLEKDPGRPLHILTVRTRGYRLSVSSTS